MQIGFFNKTFPLQKVLSQLIVVIFETIIVIFYHKIEAKPHIKIPIPPFFVFYKQNKNH